MNDNALGWAWKRQAEWSEAANRLKASLGFWRNAILCLAIAGAFLETLAAQDILDSARAPMAWAGAVCLALIPILSSHFLKPDRQRAWTRTRSASEAIKTDIYRYLVKAGPYENAAAAPQNLRGNLEATEAAVDDLAHLATLADPQPVSRPLTMTAEEYVTGRVQSQIRWYRDKTGFNARRARGLRTLELLLSIVAAALGAASGIWTEGFATAHGIITWGPWVAVLTTVGGAITAHVQASRYDALVTSYSATARRLESLVAGAATASLVVPSPEWSAFVEGCEDAISVENQGWMAEWSKDSAV